MEITEVRVKLVQRSNERLRAFCSITLDGDFVIRDLKIIDGAHGAFVAMPSRKLSDRCPKCGCKNHLRSKFCNECGQKLNEHRAPKDYQGRAKLHADVAHPINAECRERIQRTVIEAFHAELERAKSPDYKPQDFDDYDDEYDDNSVEIQQEPQAAPKPNNIDKSESRHESSSDFSDYDSLIADLKREAAKRHDRRKSASFTGQNSFEPVSEPDLPPSLKQDDVGAPQTVGQNPEPLVSKQTTSPNPESISSTNLHNSVAETGNSGDEEPKSPPGSVTQSSSPNVPDSDEDDDGFGAGIF